MKIVVQLEPDAAELALNDLEGEEFILDQDTYCYFRDQIFIKEMEKFIKKHAPGKWQDTDSLQGAEKVEAWYDKQDLIQKYYPKYRKRRQRFYLHKGGIYCYEFLGFMNVGNEIQLMKLDMPDIVNLLNRRAESPLSRLLRKLDIA